MRLEQILAIDQGTQSTRAMVFDARGTPVAAVKVPLEPYVAGRPGWAEQHPDAYWDAVCRACQGLWSQPGVDRSALVGAALTGQRGTVVNVGRDGRPLRPAIVWLDQRRTAGLPPVGGLWGLAFRLAGMRETVAYFQAEAEANWLRVHEPQVWERTHKFLMLSGYLAHRLVGRFVDSSASQVGYVPFDYKRLAWAAPGDWKWRAIPVARELLPDLVAPTEPLGTVTRAAAEATGIPEGLPLVAAANDKACEALGAGCLEPDLACLSLGTSASAIVTTSRYVEVRPLIPPFPAAVPGRHSLEVQVYRGYWMVDWFKRQFGHPERAMADAAGGPPEALFDELVRAVPAGSLGLTLQPYWSPGLKLPGPEAKGAIVGFGPAHTRAHVYRAILEGIAYGLREGKEHAERRSGVQVRELRVAGGGAQSDAAVQLTADVLGLPAVRPHTHEASGLGAAIVAAVGLGLHHDAPNAVREMTRPGRGFEPDPDASAVYDRLYREVYRRLYRRLKPLYERICDITGYPEPLG